MENVYSGSTEGASSNSNKLSAFIAKQNITGTSLGNAHAKDPADINSMNDTGPKAFTDINAKTNEQNNVVKDNNSNFNKELENSKDPTVSAKSEATNANKSASDTSQLKKQAARKNPVPPKQELTPAEDPESGKPTTVKTTKEPDAANPNDSESMGWMMEWMMSKAMDPGTDTGDSDAGKPYEKGKDYDSRNDTIGSGPNMKTARPSNDTPNLSNPTVLPPKHTNPAWNYKPAKPPVPPKPNIPKFKK